MGICLQGIFKEACEKLDINCEKGVGYLAVYRVCFSMTIFFVIMAIMMINVKTSKDGRSMIQNG